MGGIIMTTKYTSTAQQRGYKTLKTLFGHEVIGITSNNLATCLGSSNDRVFKDLKNLEEAGLAEQLPNKNWRISPLLGREAIKILNNINESRQRFDELTARYGAI